jgi:phage tail sheath gpL-like
LLSLVPASAAAQPYRNPTQAATDLELTAIELTGEAEIGVLSAGYKRCTVGLRVAAYAGWAGTAYFIPSVGPGDDDGGVETVVTVTELTAAGTDGVYDYVVTGAWAVTVEVEANDKVVTVLSLCWDIREAARAVVRAFVGA